MAFNDYPPSELGPRKLTVQEIRKPIEVIHRFFGYAHLPEIREKSWTLLKSTVSGNFCSALSKREREDLLYFFEQLERLIEAAHLLHRQKSTG